MNRSCFLLMAAAFLAAPAAYALDADPEILALPDKKTACMTELGLRSAGAVDASTIRIVIGESNTGAIGNWKSYRIVSSDDPAYEYTKFIRPSAAKVMNERSKRELQLPAGFKTKKEVIASLDAYVVDLTLPTPMQDGKTYSVVAMGNDATMVTASRTAASFKYNASSLMPKDVLPKPSLKTLTVLGLRGISPVGQNIIKLDFGTSYSPEAGNTFTNYNITVNGKKVDIKNLGRRSKTDVFQPVGWPFKVIMQHEVFLELDAKIKDGDKIRVECSPKVVSGADAAEFTFNSKKSLSSSIKVNQVGYITNSPVKVAYLGRWLGSFPEQNVVSGKTSGKEEAKAGKLTPVDFYEKTMGPATGYVEEEKTEEAPVKHDTLAPYALAFDKPPVFNVCDAATGRIVFTGTSVLGHNGLDMDGRNNHSAENVYRLDFTEFKTPGRYFISVDGVGRSFDFEIADNVYEKAFAVQSYGVFAQRCGIELKPPYSKWHRIACHNKGIILTKQNRWDEGEWIKPKNMLSTPNTKGASDAHKAIVKDPALIAFFPLNGNCKNMVAGGMTLSPIENDKYVTDGAVSGNKGDKVYSTVADRKNGFTGTLKCDESKGVTISFWFKKDDSVSGGKFEGQAIEIASGKNSGLNFQFGWGVPQIMMNRGRTGYKRVGDNTWRNWILTLKPLSTEAYKDGSHDWEAKFYVDGEFIGKFNNKGRLGEKLTFAALKGDGAADGSFSELRIFNRELSEKEVAALCERTPAEIPHKVEACGGHHDAGDYNPRSHIDVAQVLLDAYDAAPRKFYDGQLNIPEKGNGIPDIVDEALWALKVWIPLQDKDGGVRQGTEADGDPNFIQTVEMDPRGDFAWAKDAKGSHLFAATMAQASRILKDCGKTDMAKDYLARAVKAYDWAGKNQSAIGNLTKSGEYNITLRAYAAAQLYRATKDQKYHEDFKNFTPWKNNPAAPMVTANRSYDLSWAAYAYALMPDDMADPAIKESVIKALCAEVDVYCEGSNGMAYKFIRHPFAPINWGTGAYEHFLVPVWHAWAAVKAPELKAKYYEWMVRTCDNTLGNNPMNLSWVVGLGTQTVRAPLHNSRYNPTGMVVDGMQTEGPVAKGKGYNYVETVYPRHNSTFATLHSFADCHFNIGMDEGVVPTQTETMAAFGLLLPDRK